MVFNHYPKPNQTTAEQGFVPRLVDLVITNVNKILNEMFWFYFSSLFGFSKLCWRLFVVDFDLEKSLKSALVKVSLCFIWAAWRPLSILQVDIKTQDKLDWSFVWPLSFMSKSTQFHSTSF